MLPPLDRQNQQNLAEWAVKGAMCSDTVDPHQRFFTEPESHAFKQKRTIPDRTLVFAARFTGRSLDSNGVDFTLTEPKSGDLLVRGHVYNVMVGASSFRCSRGTQNLNTKKKLFV